MGQGGFRMDAIPSSENTFTLQGDFYSGDENLATGGDARVNGNNVLGALVAYFCGRFRYVGLQLYYESDAERSGSGERFLRRLRHFGGRPRHFDLDFQDQDFILV